MSADDDDLEIPPFLRGPSKRLTNTQLQRLLSPPEWKMPNSERISAMAKINAAVTNKDAPVRVTLRNPEDELREVQFKNLAALEAWYDPRKHHLLGSTNNNDITLVMFDVKTFDDAKESKLLTKEPKPPKAPKATGGRQHHQVQYNGETFNSLKPIWVRLNLPLNKFGKFRMELKAKGEHTYIDGKKKHAFKIVAG